MKILVFGYFGYRTNQLDGQTVKTRDTYQLLNEKVDANCVVDFFDTQDFQYDKLSLFRMINKIIRCNILIYLPAHNNLKYLFPFIFMFSKMFRFQILYLVIGGWLSEFITNLPIHKYMLKRIKGIFTETQLLKNDLERGYNMNNVYQLPNFRFEDSAPIIHHTSGRLNLVFLARINKMKGIDTLFSLANYISQKQLNVFIDFYGPILEKDKGYFFTELAKYKKLAYKGILEPKDIYFILQKYDVLVLPTHYYTEGLPGSIIDAYKAGIPVIVSKWKHATEFVEDGKTGFIIPFENGEEELFVSVEKLLFDEKLLEDMKNNAMKKSCVFSDSYAWKKIKPFLNNQNNCHKI